MSHRQDRAFCILGTGGIAPQSLEGVGMSAFCQSICCDHDRDHLAMAVDGHCASVTTYSW